MIGDARRKKMSETLAPAVTAVKNAGNMLAAVAVIACVALIVAIVALTAATRKATT